MGSGASFDAKHTRRETVPYRLPDDLPPHRYEPASRLAGRVSPTVEDDDLFAAIVPCRDRRRRAARLVLLRPEARGAVEGRLRGGSAPEWDGAA